ncbi:MAG TPA: protein kinase [Kofleriaceae bacterium]|jgi:serine/threonine-protein kinase
MGPSPDDSGVVPLGSVLDGRYRVDAVLGKGGMGRVYKGEHTGIGRAVAIKVLHPDLGRNKEAAARFQREALASGRLDHPNIVGVSDFGVMEDGSLYLVMEALEGEGLGARLEREKRVPWPDAADIVRQVLAGLRHAHDKGVVHRDIKPDNIFLATKDGERIVKILDFGIAKLYAGSGDDPAMTRAGLTVGTPAYLSPEQAVGGEIKPASDLYSLSVVFYETLAGRAPFEDKDPLQIMTAHVSRDVPSFAEVAPDLRVPPALEALIRKGLEKMQADRFTSANEYLAALDNVLRDAGIAIAPRGSGSVSIPPPMTPAHGSPLATPMPFSSRSGTSAPTSAFTPAPFPRVPRAATDPSGPHEPIPKKWLWIAGIVFGIAIAIAIALKVSGTSAPAKPQPRARHSEAAPPTTPPPPPVTKPAVAPAGDSAATGSAPVEATLDRDTELKAALHDLEDSTTCTDRRAAISKLVALGDQRAILPLRRARYRMEGGVLGFNEHNSNACLKADAEAAIKALGGTIR